ncbi:NADH-quinone oxidoreductase subunit A [Tessaracoccus sp. OH4464_COT-324]|uniref:NADH-quinone oxidoreductase subunit A n=1 Tax=Tessaracoccus sp. OH4464_COT-324 TaxID=2491059 RepID=UPI000F636DE2|nr:NADH-quinone oxidoreductase subunit A [Tessaracoccus sp. OH4464_COT-324]RRD46967.1 NADH-quinone oxidoreductase subunit A [Tessaracoccus sp. OH4464_COT-324]
MNPYIPIVGMVVLATVFVVVSMILSINVGPARYNRAKYDSYECGIQPTPQPAGGGRFPVKYYITAMLFIVFDIEVVFLYPFAVARDQMELFVVLQMVLFIALIFVAFFYVLRRKGLDWD